MERLTKKTFYCWIIANLESVFAICCILMMAVGDAVSLELLNNETFVRWVVLPYLIVAGIVSIGFSIYIAKFTWNNFKEVVSRRMLWRNSNVGLFQKRLEYSLSRFVATLFSCALLAITILLMFL
jgi:hypothetical protein